MAPLKSRTTDSSHHSIRCSDAAWDRARERAEREGWVMNRAVGQLIEGYANGQINLPEIVWQPEAEQAAS